MPVGVLWSSCEAPAAPQKDDGVLWEFKESKTPPKTDDKIRRDGNKIGREKKTKSAKF